MTLYKLKLLIITLILCITGCREKDELTIPVNLDLKIGISPPIESSGDEYFYFNWGHIGVQRIWFKGKREAGEDFFFETDPKTNMQLVEFNLQPEIISAFDIPQGIYNYMEWDINLKRIETRGLIGIDSPNIGLVIWAIYEYLDESDISIFLCIDNTELFSFRSYDPDGNSRIVLSENKVREAILFLDLYYAFRPISRESIEDAEISNDIHGQPIIIISSNNNKNLYENLLSRISQSARVLVY